jgi:hypothetical protein
MASGFRWLEKDRNSFRCDHIDLCSEECDLCHDIINRPELSRFDPSADTFLDIRIQSRDLPEEGRNGCAQLDRI